MMFRKSKQLKKQAAPSQKVQEKQPAEALTNQELRQMAMEMAHGCEMLLPGGFPDGIWYFY